MSRTLWRSAPLLSRVNRRQAADMNFSFSSKLKDLQRRLRVFMDEHIYPNE